MKSPTPRQVCQPSSPLFRRSRALQKSLFLPSSGLLLPSPRRATVSLGEDDPDLEDPWSGGRAEATIRVREEVADRSRARDIVKSRDERQPGSADREVLAGLVERVTFHNPDSGFCVLRVKARGHRDLVTVVGHAAMVAAGEWITASGEWVNDRTHGQQFKARFLRSSAPSSIEGIEKYLGSGMIRGIGPVYARKLVRAFGEEVFDVIEAEPERLREVSGIGRVRAGRITTPGPSRRSFARSWCSCTAMAWARHGRCGSSGPMGPTRSKS